MIVATLAFVAGVVEFMDVGILRGHLRVGFVHPPEVVAQGAADVEDGVDHQRLVEVGLVDKDCLLHEQLLYGGADGGADVDGVGAPRP